MKKVSGRLANLTPEQREKLLQKLREQKKELSVNTVIDTPTLKQTKALESDLALSFSQQRLWFLDQLEGNQATYNIPAILRIHGRLDVDALEQAFDILVERHESLRTRFDNQDGLARPTPLNHSAFNLRKSDLSELSPDSQEQQLAIFSQREALKPFSLEQDSLLRAHLVKLGGQGEASRYALLICMHHIISDAWSMGIFIQDMSVAYSSLKAHHSVEFTEHPYRYLDFAHWQKTQLDTGAYTKQSLYWQEALKGSEALNFPLDKPRPAQQTFAGKQIKFEIPRVLSERLQLLAKTENKTLFMVLLSAWQILLYRYSGQTDICVGTPVANRNHAELENTIGFFVNTLAIRGELDAEKTFTETLTKIQKNSVGAFANQDIPFERLIDELGLERDMSQSPIFQNFFSYQNESVADSLNFTGLSIELEAIHTQTAKFDLSLDVVRKKNHLEGLIEFNTDLFYSSSIERIVNNFLTLLESIVANPEEKISRLNLLSDFEYEQQLKVWRRPRQNFPSSSIVCQFSEQVLKTPDAYALKSQSYCLTYAELDNQSNQLARYLSKNNIGTGSFVGLCMERSIDLVVAVFGIIKTGAAYLPIDPAYPCDRIKLLIAEGDVSLLLTQSDIEHNKLNEIRDAITCPLLPLDSDEQWQKESSLSLDVAISAECLLYVIYTSGSTGVPKRTAATHRGESNLVAWYHKASQSDDGNRYLLISPIGFDLGQKNIFTPLLHGDLLVLPEMGEYDPELIIDAIEKEKISCLNCAPSAFYPLIQDQKNDRKLASLRYLFLGGENIQAEKLASWINKSECQLINSYGPSECTDIASFYVVDAIDDYTHRAIPIGKPSANVDLFLLDRNLQLAPIGAHAQLYIGGEGVGPGYLGRDDLSAEKFINNPIPGESGRIYATGDIVRYADDGNIEYVGRSDDQIKIRGYRVEISEIVNTLLSDSLVKDAAVTLQNQDNGREFLVAYLVVSDPLGFDPHYFKKILKQQLPDFMVPSVYMTLERLPLTPNGKLDFKALPEPDLASLSSNEFVAPSNHNEKIIQEVWQRVLGLDTIGVHDNFFELGGDSILSIQIISAVRKQQLVLRPNQIFRYPTIAELAQVAGGEQSSIQAEQGRVKGSFDLSPAQQWFFNSFDSQVKKETLNHFNQSVLLRLKTPLTIASLKKIVLEIVTKHDALNLRFHSASDSWQQMHREQALSLADIDALTSELQDRDLLSSLKLIQANLSIESGRLCHFCLIDELKSGQREQSLYIVVHHLVMDGISWRVLLEDLDSLLTNSERKTNESGLELLGDKTLSFKQWSKALSRVADSEFLQDDKNYWLNALDAIGDYHEIVPEIASTNMGTYADQKRVGFSLNPQLSKQFLQQANHAFHTEANDLLLCALHDALSPTDDSGNAGNGLLIQMEAHGRELEEPLYEKLSMPDVSRTIAWFTSLYPVLLSTDFGIDSWAGKLKKIKEQLHNVPNKGLGFGIHTSYSQEGDDRSLRSLQKPMITFNYLGQFDAQINTQHFTVDTSYQDLDGADHLDQHKDLPKISALDVLLFVRDGCLRCDFLYDASRFDEKSILDYLAGYQKALESLIRFCCEQNKRYLSPSDLPAASLPQRDIELIEKHIEELAREKEQSLSLETVHELLPTQSGMLFHSLYSGEQSHEESYLEQFCVQLNGNLKPDLLEQAWREIVFKYANLRSIFYWQFSEPLQLVLNTLEISIAQYDITESANARASSEGRKNGVSQNALAKQAMLEFLENDKAKGFDLSQPPLMRVSLLSFDEDKYWLVWTYHHILLDGWSVPLVLNDLFENYAALETMNSHGEDENLQKRLTQKSLYRFEDYVAWYRNNNHDDDLFWKAELAGFYVANAIDLEPLAFPMSEQDLAGEESSQLSLGHELSESLRDFSKQHRLTLNSVVQGAWAKILSHYSSDQDVVFGSTVSGRSDQVSGAENIVGLFINTLPLRIDVDPQTPLLSYLHGIQEKQQQINQHQSSALVRIQRMAGLDNDATLFNSILVFENFPVNERLKQANQWFEVGDFHSFEKTNYDITISVEPGDQINFRVLFNGAKYRKPTIDRLLGHMETVLSGFVAHPQEALLAIPYVSSAETDALDVWNKTSTSYPRESNLVDLFQAKVAQSPNQLALKFHNTELSYRELNENANRLAAYLQAKGASKDKRIALFMDRSAEFLTSVIAVTKTGAAYIPLDPGYPEERLRYMLADCEPSLIITVSENKEVLKNVLTRRVESDEILFLDELVDTLETHNSTNIVLREAPLATDLAYLMYTSGSTGQPKGVCLNHRSIVRLVIDTWYLSIGPKDKIGHICNVCFDASVYEIWGALLNGASLIGFDKDTILSEDKFSEQLLAESVTNMLMPTSLFHLYSRHHPEIFKKMRCLLAGGEPLLPEAARRVLAENPQITLLNVYGPTENGVLTTVFDTWNLVEGAINTPIGRPISNTTVYIVDKFDNEVPVGVIGELVTGGDGVGLGYWNKQDLTDKTYVVDPFSQEEGARMYRTGDLARRLPDGSFEVLGRRDDQLKIRGFRVEPSEIIERLVMIDGVNDAVVVINETESARKHLIAYYIAEPQSEINIGDLKTYLSENLPNHMVPSFFIEISKIPMTPNGKLDKRKLPKPEFDESQTENYVAPRNEIEKSLAAIWSDVLKIRSVGIFDNFFELGGDSIISIQIVSRAKRAGINITPKLLFENPTVSALAQGLSQNNSLVVAEQGLVSGEVALTPIQKWFFEQNLSDPDHFNQSLLFKLDSFITLQNITPIVSALIKQHDALRLRYSKIKNEWVQKHDNSARSLSSLADILSEYNLSQSDSAEADILAHANKIQESLSLCNGPVFKVVLYHLGQKKQKLLIIVHHLVIDGVSWRILVDDINLALQQQSNNQAIDFGEKTSAFQFFSKTVEQYARSHFLESDKAYWKTLLKKAANTPSLGLNIDGANVSLERSVPKVHSHRFSLDEIQSRSLLIDCHQAYRSDVQDILVLALSMSLKYSGISDNAWLTMEGHGRNVLQGGFSEQVDNSKTLGWFTCMYPVLIDLGQLHSVDDGVLASLIAQVKQNLRSIPSQGSSFQLLQWSEDGIGEDNEEGSEFSRLLSSLPKPHISFNYLGQLSSSRNDGVLHLDENYQGQDSSPNNSLSHPLNFSAAFKENCFEFQLLFDESYLDIVQVDSLQKEFLKALSQILEHCADSRHFGFTPSDLPYFSVEQSQIDKVCDVYRESTGMDGVPLRSIYPLSPMQEGMLFHSRLDNASGMYCEQVSVMFSGDMQIAAMQQAWNEVIISHDILRTSFVWEDLPKPLQLVRASADIEIQVLDWRQGKDLDTRLKQFLTEDRSKGFDFSKAPLMRLHYIHWPSGAGKSLGRFIWTYHHILLDGWSMPILMKEVFSRYNAGLGKDLPERKGFNTLKPQLGRYEHYVEWLYRHHQKEQTSLDLVSTDENKVPTEDQQFWRSYLAGFEEPNTLGLGRRNEEIEQGLVSAEQDLRYQELACQLSEEETQALQSLAAVNHVTLNTVMQGAWALLLNRYSGDQDIVYGITVSGRPADLTGVESIIGLFINTIPFRVQVNAEQKLDNWLKSILKNQVQLRQFETSSLVDIQAQSQIDGSRALFDSILVFENYPLDETLSQAPQGLALEELQVYEQTNFPLSLIILPSKTLDIRILYDTHAFTQTSIDRILQHLKTILLAFVSVEDKYQTELQDISYLSQQERSTIIQEWNDTKTDYPRNSYLHEIVAQQSQNRTAIIYRNGDCDVELSFGEIESKATNLATFMQCKYEIQSGDRIVICLNRSPDLIVSILAILKLGACYVPLDPGYPEERQRYMLEDTQTRLIISDNENAALVRHLCSNKAFRESIEFIDVDEKKDEISSVSDSSEMALARPLQNEDGPAAILYTSGSTGQPKGVCLTHRGLSRMVMNTNYMQLDSHDRVAHVSNICFDAASFEIWAALLNGLPLVILKRDIMLDLPNFERALKENNVSVLLITTALFNLVAKERVSAFETINYLFFGGEACNVGMVKRVLEIAKPKHLMHMYGPSENATYATWYEVKEISDEAKTIPIGRPVSNSQVYIMNQQGELLPPGIAGEIVCAGDGLAQGYLNKPDQTQKAFVTRSTVTGDAQRMYLTGDLGVCLPDGNIEILGRIDNQVKIRGHRIEPEEIIARINALIEVKKAYVLVKQDEEDKKYLVAYYVPESNWIIDQEDRLTRARSLKQKLKTQMPEYMVPSIYVEIDELPLTPNGKIDTKALPDADMLPNSTEYQAPENAIELALVNIWEEVLEHDKIGVHDDFFELGGHSLLATQIHSRIRQQLEIDIPLRTLFELPTIREFSEFWAAISVDSKHAKLNNLSDDDEEYEEGEL